MNGRIDIEVVNTPGEMHSFYGTAADVHWLDQYMLAQRRMIVRLTRDLENMLEENARLVAARDNP
jgi:hypothetical protein